MRAPLARGSASAAVASAEFEALVGPWVAEMYRLAAAIVGVDSAEDVTQDALVDAWRGFKGLRDRSRTRAWLHSIVVRRASKHLRALASRPRVTSIQPEDAWRTPRVFADPGVDIYRRELLDRAFEGLPLEQRACVVLHYSLDIPVARIASTLGIPEGTVKSRIHAGIQHLRQHMDRDEL